MECVGGGGAGGGSGVTSGSSWSVGGGGGAGGYIKFLATASQIGASLAVTIAAGGTGVANGTGGFGGNTVFGSLGTANGGSGGTTINNSIAATTPGGAGGGSSLNTGASLLQITGQAGGYGAIQNFDSIAFPGVGGSSRFGVGAMGSVGYLNVSGTYYPGYGCGGSGAVNSLLGGGGTNKAGGGGGPGAVIVMEYHF